MDQLDESENVAHNNASASTMENLGETNNKNVSLNLIADYGSSESDSEETPTIENMMNDTEETVGLSAMVLKNNIINACAHGPLSGSATAMEDVDSIRHMIIDSSENDVVEYEVTEYRDLDSDSDSSDSSDSISDIDSVKDIEEIFASDEDEGGGRVAKPEPPRVLGELGLEDLPPIEDLAISLPAQETAPVGTVASIVDKLVIVRAYPGTPAVDIDSILFLEKGAKTLGKVFDVFGPVKEPHYCVRFNSVDHVKERGIEAGMDVYIAPQSQQHTNYVFLAELMKIKGSDASWYNDVEPPPNHVDYSDDEEERRANQARKELKKQNESQPEETEKRKPQEAARRSSNQRPSDSSSRFGSGPSHRARNPFTAGSRRSNGGVGPRPARPWPSFSLRPPGRPPCEPAPPFSAPPHFLPPSPMIPPFDPRTPPPYMNVNTFQFGANPRLQGPPMGQMPPPFRYANPYFGSGYYVPSSQPQWSNIDPPPPPGT